MVGIEREIKKVEIAAMRERIVVVKEKMQVQEKQEMMWMNQQLEVVNKTSLEGLEENH